MLKSARSDIEHEGGRAVNDSAARASSKKRASSLLINSRNTPRLYKSEFDAFVATPKTKLVRGAGAQWCVGSISCSSTPARAAAASSHSW